MLSTASCDKHEDRTGDPECDVDEATGGAVIQTILTATCEGGKVNWEVWKKIHSGCEDDCMTQEYKTACKTDGCKGPVVRGPFNRGQKYKKNCN